jgi:putative transcriptional regulator
MSPTHHLPMDWMIDHARGALDEPSSVLVATHLVLCPECRARLAALEAAVADRVWASVTPSPLSKPAPSDVALDAAPVPPPPIAVDPLLPGPVAALAGPSSSLSWRWLAPGLDGVDLMPARARLPLRLVRLRRGKLLIHGHRGQEAGVVLQGGWSDQFGSYRRGDAAFLGADVQRHEQQVHDDGDCIALVLNEREAALPFPFGWLSGWAIRA